MKKFYLFLSLVIFYNVSFSAPIITANANGNWNRAAIWDLNRLPKVGDTIVIPSDKVVTINDDQDFNGFVYIKVFGKVVFQGNNSTLTVNTPSTIIVYPGGEIAGSGSASQKIRYDNSNIFKGNEIPISGPQISSIASKSFAFFASTPLPVKFVGFAVTGKDKNVLIQWSTSEEISADMYQVERSFDGSNWNTIAYVAAVGNSSALNNYSFTDKNVSAKVVYYRIKEVDVDGKTAYTAVKSIKSEVATAVSEIKIAAISNKVVLQFPQDIKGNITVRFVSASGQVVDQKLISNPVGQVVLNSKVTGNYIIAVSNGQDINTARQVIL